MADITLQLLWYRLTESSSLVDTLNFVIDAGGSVLNWIFVGWLFLGAMLVIYFTVLESIRQRRLALQQVTYKVVCEKCDKVQSQTTHPIKTHLDHSQPIATAQSPMLLQLDISSHDLINQDAAGIFDFLIKNGLRSGISETCLNSLSEASQYEETDLFMTFDSILQGAGMPGISRIQTVSRADDELICLSKMRIEEVQISLTVSDNSVSVQSNLLLAVHDLQTEVELKITKENEQLLLTACIKHIEKLDVEFTPYHAEVDYISNEGRLRQHFSDVLTKSSVQLYLSLNKKEDATPQIVQETMCSKQSVASVASGPPKPPRHLGDKRLMIKLIKATKLNKAEAAACDAYCTLEVDSPLQLHSTSIVKNTLNPYWDEHFLFDLGTHTGSIKFKVFNSHTYRTAESANQYLGEASVELETLRSNQGSRQMLPLVNNKSTGIPVSGSVTLEAFFVDSAEFVSSATMPIDDDVFCRSVEPMAAAQDVTAGSSAASPRSTLDRDQGLTIDFGKKESTTDRKPSPNLSTDPNSNTELKPPPSPVINVRSLDLEHADVITVQPGESVTEAALKELSSNKPHSDTLIIRTMSHDPSENSPVRDSPITEQSDPLPIFERRSRLSGLKKRFTKTKDKKRSHSIERSSGIDQNQYLDANISPGTGQLASSTPKLTPKSKRKFGGSLKKLFGIGRSRSSSRISNQSLELPPHSPNHLEIDYNRKYSTGSSPLQIGQSESSPMAASSYSDFQAPIVSDENDSGISSRGRGDRRAYIAEDSPLSRRHRLIDDYNT